LRVGEGGGGGGKKDDDNHVGEAKWANDARKYLERVGDAIWNLDPTTLTPDVVAWGENREESDDEDVVGRRSSYHRVPLLSDKYRKSSNDSSSSSSSSTSSWSFPFHGGKSLHLIPIGSFGHVGNAGFVKCRSNGCGGNVLPVLDVAVLFDGSSMSSSNDDNVSEGRDGDGGPYVSGKDYLNRRYDDKRNILAVHVAKQLSRKNCRDVIGAVHLTRVFGDSSKVGLILTPPTIAGRNEDAVGEGTTSSSSGGRARKRKHVEDDDEDDGKVGKGKRRADAAFAPKFRVRLIFGVRGTDVRRQGERKAGSSSSMASEDDDDDDDDYDEGDDENSSTTIDSWIPPSRLFPDRNNNRSSTGSDADGSGGGGGRGTPHYTNSLAEDMHLVSTTRLINSTISTLSSSSSSSSSSTSTSLTAFHETLLLLKVWSLQRGFLRGHDAFTTTTLGVILTYLYRTKAVGRRMGCLQAFSAFMKFWSETDWLGEDDNAVAPGKGGGGGGVASKTMDSRGGRRSRRKAALVIPDDDAGWNESQTAARCSQARRYLEDVRGRNSSSTATSMPKTLLDCYRECYSSDPDDDKHVDSPVLLDPTMTLNYLARLSPSFVRESRAEARAALMHVHGSSGSAFRRLFLETNRFWTRYDAYFRVPLSNVPRMTSSMGKKPARVWGGDRDDLGYDESVCRGIIGVISRALGDRAIFVRALTGGNGIDIRKPSRSDGRTNDDLIATTIISDSDQNYCVPIRGSSVHRATLGYAARAKDRCPASPAASLPSSNDVGVEPCLVVGIRIEPNASRRVVDRGPPAEDSRGSDAFVALWGEAHAQLRRFQDGAIVRAVVWNDPAVTSTGVESVQFSGMDRSMGGIVERIVQHIVGLHFMDDEKKSAAVTKTARKISKSVAFELRDMISFIDGCASSSPVLSPFSDSLALHKNVLTAFDSLADFLRQNTRTTNDNTLGSKGRKVSNLGLPLAIDEVEPMSPCLRYSALFPPVPHPLLGGSGGDVLGSEKRKVSGSNIGSPILVQIRFEGTSKWPASLNAMGAAKCAMLIQLAEGIDKMKRERGAETDGDDLAYFDGPMDVTPKYLDIGYRGYSWRIIVRADQELRMLRGLKNPTAEAKALRSVRAVFIFIFTVDC
jgi:U3 small nucleolar RNA-associated protein 22